MRQVYIIFCNDKPIKVILGNELAARIIKYELIRVDLINKKHKSLLINMYIDIIGVLYLVN